MFSISAFKRTAVLLLSILFMAAVWGVGRVPGASLQMITFACLSSALLVDISSFRTRVKYATIWACYGSVGQFFISVTSQFPLLQMFFSTLFAYFTFLTLPDYRSGCVVLLTGYLAVSAPPEFLIAIDRIINIFIGMISVLLITAPVGMKPDAKDGELPVTIRYSAHQALILAAQLGIGTLIFHLFRLQQGVWIMMTILFVNLSKPPDSTGAKLAYQRIFAVPAGIILGGFLLSAFFRIDSRLVWLLPFIGASGFFILYNYGNFFLFSVVFMVTMTFFADLMSGPYQEFHLWNSFFSRSLSTFAGAICVLLFVGSQRNKKGEAV